jgi:hypothetical protein
MALDSGGKAVAPIRQGVDLQCGRHAGIPHGGADFEATEHL